MTNILKILILLKLAFNGCYCLTEERKKIINKFSKLMNTKWWSSTSHRVGVYVCLCVCMCVFADLVICVLYKVLFTHWSTDPESKHSLSSHAHTHTHTHSLTQTHAHPHTHANTDTHTQAHTVLR